LLDIVFGVYVYTAFQVRANSVQRRLIETSNTTTDSIEPEEYLKQAV
jgi:hypothetical protein